ncbi:MAG: GtrA family protein [Alphaproteobacteria bacterium]|nr:GtrA family protein [Alphaproteobacteria bacterium]
MTDPSISKTLRSAPAAASVRPTLAIVVPVFRAGKAATALVTRLRAALAGEDWALVFVDDNSPDDTLATIAALGDARVRAIRRVGRNGLTHTCLVTMLASGAEYVAMLDGASLYDETLLGAMLRALRQETGQEIGQEIGQETDQETDQAADLAVAARPSVGGGWIRRGVRALLGGATRSILSATLTDPASGFFMIRRDALEKLTPSLSSVSHQVLLDLIATARGRLRIVEIAGSATAISGRRSELKLALELTALMIAKFSSDAVSVRFLLFCLVGFTGVGAHLALLDGALMARLPFTAAQTVATIGAMIWNFSLNNMVTYGDQRLTGFAYFTGLLRFMAICGIGAISNVGVASLIYAHETVWWIAGLGGAVMGAVWNYVVTAVFVWRPR